MLPPALVDVAPGMNVLDMCAAPAQDDAARRAPRSTAGVVVANDADALRAHVGEADGEPRRARGGHGRDQSLRAKAAPAPVERRRRQRVRPDRLRRPVHGRRHHAQAPEVFMRWETAHALRQHPVQLQIAMRGAALLNVGGVVCYSTCSLNPIENESVVANSSAGAAAVSCAGAASRPRLAGGCAGWSVVGPRLPAPGARGPPSRRPGPSDGEKRLYEATM